MAHTPVCSLLNARGTQVTSPSASLKGVKTRAYSGATCVPILVRCKDLSIVRLSPHAAELLPQQP
eukprot:1659718-Amphidinium_carterae.1